MTQHNTMNSMTERQCNTRRRRRRTLTAFSSLIALFCAARETTAFASTITTIRGTPLSQKQQHDIMVRPLQMARSSKEMKQSAATIPKRLTPSEEKALIYQVVEYRRLVNLEKELALKSSGKTMPLLSIRAKEAGYGQDLQEYEAALDNGQTAREELVTRNMGLVHYCVKDIIGTNKKRLNSLSIDDLIQEGAIGLARAIDKYNPAAGAKLSTYAVYWIRAAVLRCIAERDDLLRVPSHVSDAVRKATRAAQRLGLELDGDEILAGFGSRRWKEAHAAKALAVEAGLTDAQLKQAMLVKARRNTGGYTSFEPWMQSTNSQMQDVSLQEPTQEVSPDVEQLKTILSRYLRPKEMEALSWRYGLIQQQQQQEQQPRPLRDYLAETEEELYGTPPEAKAPPTKGKWGEAMSFTEVGKNMKISAEYGRRLCHTALSKLRAAAEEGTLEPALLF